MIYSDIRELEESKILEKKKLEERINTLERDHNLWNKDLTAKDREVKTLTTQLNGLKNTFTSEKVHPHKTAKNP